MKKLVLWLARVFKVELPQVVKTEVVKVVVEKNFYDGDTVEGNLEVRGDLTVNGACIVNGELTVWRK